MVNTEDFGGNSLGILLWIALEKLSVEIRDSCTEYE